MFFMVEVVSFMLPWVLVSTLLSAHKDWKEFTAFLGIIKNNIFRLFL